MKFCSTLFLFVLINNVLAQCPPSVILTNVTPTSAEVNVSPFNGTIYDLNWTCGNPAGTIMSLTGATTTISNLLPGCEFSVIVNATGCGSFSSSDTAEILIPCAAPSLQSSGTGSQLTWTATPGVNNYRIFYRDALSTGVWSSVLTGNVTSYTLSGLNPTTGYIAFIRGLNCPTIGVSTQSSNYVLFTTTPSSNCTPTPYIDTPSTTFCSQVTVYTTGSGPWQIYFQRINPTPVTITSFSTSSSPTNFTVPPGTYLIYAQSVCGGPTYSNFSNLMRVKVGTTCSPPYSINLSNINCTGFTANWQTVLCTNLSGYRLFVRQQGSGTWTTYFPGLATSYAISNLVPNTIYEVALRSVSCGNSPSQISSIQTIYTHDPSCRIEQNEKNILTTSSFSLDVFPNPFSNELQLSITEVESAATFEIYDVFGQLVYDVKFSPDDFTVHRVINTSEFAGGVYIARFIINGEEHNMKIVRQ